VLGAGLDHDRPNRLDVAKCFSLPVTLVFLPAADIATYVAEGDVDAGITGLDVVHESNSEIVEILVRHHKFSFKLEAVVVANIIPFDRSIVRSISIEPRYRQVQTLSTSTNSLEDHQSRAVVWEAHRDVLSLAS